MIFCRNVRTELYIYIEINCMVHASELFKFINVVGDTTLITNLNN